MLLQGVLVVLFLAIAASGIVVGDAPMAGVGISVMLLFVADLAYPGGLILNEVSRFSLFATLLGILLTSVYLAGFVERRYKSIFGMGIDSVVVLLAYTAGLVVLFSLR